MDKKRITLSDLDALSNDTTGQDVLRYIGLPMILGQEKDALLYFLGRNLAQQISYSSMEEVYLLFQKLQWGNLELIKDKKQHLIFHLMSDDIVQRINAPIDTDFRLESGFIAEAIQQLFQRATECTETVNQRLYRVEFKVFFID